MAKKAEAATKPSQETKYKTSEFVEAAKTQFDVEPFMVAAALTGVDECTLSEATSIIKKFLRSEVK